MLCSKKHHTLLQVKLNQEVYTFDVLLDQNCPPQSIIVPVRNELKSVPSLLASDEHSHSHVSYSPIDASQLLPIKFGG